MKIITRLLSAALLAAVAAPASAQDDESWTGFYAGVQAGAGRERLKVAGTNGNIQAFPAQGPFVVSGSDSGSLIGWTGGIGVEQRLGSHIRIGIEGRYTNYGSKSFAFANATRTSAGTLAAAPFTAVTGEGVYPGTTRIGLSDAQVNLRPVFAF